MLGDMFPPLHVLHADTLLVAVNKPAGLLAVPGRGEAGLVNLTAQVQATYTDALVVHRLDMATSGLMLFARGAAAQRQLSIAFAARQVHKRYVAVVHGTVAAEAGEIDLPLIADWPRRPRQVVDPVHGKPALTRWRVVARGEPGPEGPRTRLALEPVTGRSHQLRVHLQSMGHPICGDTLYAPEPQHSPRLLLHACHLALAHPADGTAWALDSPAPF
jgi:tRNA pseudouridine32 synthase/23S rRNA pseudouridine746 synthase